MSIMEQKKNRSDHYTKPQQEDNMKKQLEDLQMKYDEVLKSGMEHCRRRMDLESLVEKYKKFKEQDQKLAEDLQKEVSEKTFIIDEKNSKINELMKTVHSLKVKYEESKMEVHSNINPSKIENKPEQQKQEVTEHIKDLRKHNDFLEKHLDLLLVAQTKLSAPEIEGVDKELMVAKQRIEKLEVNLDIERRKAEAVLADKKNLETEINNLKAAMTISNTTLNHLSLQLKGVEERITSKEHLDAIADRATINEKWALLNKQVYNDITSIKNESINRYSQENKNTLDYAEINTLTKEKNIMVKEDKIVRQELCASSLHSNIQVRSKPLPDLALSAARENTAMQEKDVETQQQSNPSYLGKHNIREIGEKQRKDVIVQRCLIPRPIRSSKEKIISADNQTRKEVKTQRIKLQSIDSQGPRSAFQKAVHRKEKHSGLINPSVQNAKDADNRHVNMLGGYTTNKRFGLLTRRIIDPG